MQHVSWSRSANIYEVNVRQYTPEGTLNAFAAHLPRLHQMGVDILWLTPLQAIGKLKRQGALGLQDAVADHTKLNPEFGTMKDLKALVQEAHALGMKVIMDWVATHTARDHAWVKQNPDWYLKNDKATELTARADVIALDYSQKPLWTAMIQVMLHWVKEADIDGFRCNAAHWVPLKFWQQARLKLEAQKPMFLVADATEPEWHDAAFDVTCDDALQEVLHSIAKGQADVRDIKTYVNASKANMPKEGYRMTYTMHPSSVARDSATVPHLGDAFAALIVIAATLPGMPLLTSGQEAGLQKALKTTEKDSIDWHNLKHEKLFNTLWAMKKKHPALHNGATGAPVEIFDVDNHHILAFRRQKGVNVVSVQVNLTGQNQTFNLHGKPRKLGAWEHQIQTN